MAVNNIAYIEKTLPRVVDEVFVQESLTERLFSGNAVRVDFLDAKTCKVFKVASSGLQDYARANNASGGTNAFGNVVSNTETFTLGQERYCAIPVDTLDSLDDGGTVIGHLAKRFIAEHVVPEFDAYRLSKLAGYTSTTFGNRVAESISANTIISKFNGAFKWLKNQKVDGKDQIIYVSTTVMELIRNTTELNRRLVIEQVPKGDAYTTIEKYEGREIIEVPEDEFYTDISIGNGFHPSSSSKVINYLVVDKRAPIVIKKLAFNKIYDSENGASYFGYVGKLFTQLYYHDLFVPENKKVALYCSVSTTDAKTIANNVLVNAKAGATQGKSIITEVLPQPATIAYDGIYQATSSSAPALDSATSGLTQIYLNTEFTPNASHNYICLGLGGKVVAVSKDWEDDLPVGA